MKQVDIGIFQNILKTAKVVDMSYPLFIDNWILMQRFPNEMSRLDDPIKPFTSTVNCLDYEFIYFLPFLACIAASWLSSIMCHFRIFLEKAV